MTRPAGSRLIEEAPLNRSYLPGGFTAIAAANLVLLALSTVIPSKELSHERGLIELLQLLVCAAAAGAFGVAVSFTPARLAIASDAKAIRVGSICLFTICMIALYREIDFREVAGPDWLHTLSGPWIRDTGVIVGLILTLLYLWMRRSNLPGLLRLVLNWDALPLWIGGSLLFIAAVAIDPILRFDNSVLVEEVIELNGFIFILWAATRHARLAAGHFSPATPQRFAG